MVEKRELTSEEKHFLLLVSRAAFCNPFSAERPGLNRQLAGLKKGSPEKIAERAVNSVRQRLGKIDPQGNQSFRSYKGEESELLKRAFLFDIYYQFIDRFDALIFQQIKAGDEPSPVPFAGDALRVLRQRGFSAEESRHYFAFFYQLRRAFHFIFHSIIGRSPSMENLRSHLWNNIFTHDSRQYEKFLWNRMEDFSTFLIGETGTGKGTAAAAVGRSGYIPFDEKKEQFRESFTRNFIEINLSQFPETLIESELFGHRKGAFTGAVEGYQGVFARCSQHGAIFLDEIGEVSVPVQIKLLKVLQERSFTEVGSHEKRRFRGRVIAATNKPLDVLRRNSGFRDDFFYRLCSDVIHVPPLRQVIKEDPLALEALIRHTVERIIGEPLPELAETVTATLNNRLGLEYPWPGNVRELEQAVRRIILTRGYEGDLRNLPVEEGKASIGKKIVEGKIDAQNLLASYCAELYQRHGSYEEVARISRLDRRTVKKYINAAETWGRSTSIAEGRRK